MIKVIGNPVEISYEEAINKYEGYCLGMRITDAYEDCIFRVKVIYYTDRISDDKFERLNAKLGVVHTEWADLDTREFLTKESYDFAKSKYARLGFCGMSEFAHVRGDAYMVLGNLAFCFNIYKDMRWIKIFNIKNTYQVTVIWIKDDKTFIVRRSSMLDIDRNKVLSVINLLKKELLDGFRLWEKEQNKRQSTLEYIVRNKMERCDDIEVEFPGCMYLVIDINNDIENLMGKLYCVSHSRDSYKELCDVDSDLYNQGHSTAMLGIYDDGIIHQY